MCPINKYPKIDRFYHKINCLQINCLTLPSLCTTVLDFICVTRSESFHCFQSTGFKGLNTHCVIQFMNTKYLVAERDLTQAEFFNTGMLALATAE